MCRYYKPEFLITLLNLSVKKENNSKSTSTNIVVKLIKENIIDIFNFINDLSN
jgi:hypothetical protein